LFYKVTNHDIPDAWIKVMKESIKSCGSSFAARRMVSEYIEKFYSKALRAAK